MVFFNYATMQMAAKIVYYGPGLCGKTTNLHHIYAKTSPQSRGEMVSLETETDRTLFFDLLPIDVGVIGGFKTRLQLYTIPGQVFYNTTRKLVLKGVDGVVFVADSQTAMLDANVESFKNLQENLGEIGLTIDEIPLVLQLNKRDLPNIAAVETILDTLDPDRRYEYAEAVAASGIGVFETLKQVSKLTLRTLRRRMTGEEPMKPVAPRKTSALGDLASFRVKAEEAAAAAAATPAPAPAPAAPPARPAAPPAAPPPRAAEPARPVVATPAPPTFATGAFVPPPAAAASAPAPVPSPTAAAAPAAQPTASRAPVQVIEPEPPPPSIEDVFTDSTLARTADVDSHILTDVPVATHSATPSVPQPEPFDFSAPVQPFPTAPPARPVTTPAFTVPSPAATPRPVAPTPPVVAPPIAPKLQPEPEIDFSQTDKPAKAAAEVKHVKVRSSVDIMAELDSLRKKATSTTPVKSVKKEVPIELHVSGGKKSELQKTLQMQVAPGVLPRAKSLRVTVSFEDETAGVLQKQEQFIELGDSPEVQSLSVLLKIDPV